VILGDPEAPPDTWEVQEVQVIGRDTARAETIFARNKWGKMLDHPILFQDLTAWCAMSRRGLTELSWDEFRDTYIEVSVAPSDEDDDDVATPTRPVPETGY
jgi:hypothetical protein